MIDGAVETLLLAIEADAPGALDQGDLLFLNARPQAALAALGKRLTCIQDFRPDFRDCEAAGMTVLPSTSVLAPARRFDAVFVLAGKHRRLNEAMLAEACDLANPGATVIVAGQKELGIASLRKRAGAHAEIIASHAKHHATAFSFAAATSFPPEWRDIATCPAPGYRAQAGLFSADHPDPASLLLADVMDDLPAGRLSGRVADFGCGWGYLAGRLLERHAPARLVLADASSQALSLARVNLEPRCPPSTALEAIWCDITREPPAGPFDTIIMNPPFHRGRKGEPDIGIAFIDAARKALAPRGSLLLVANRHLPYEAALQERFATVRVVAEIPAFKVIEAGLR